ncbi:MmpS family transport accessory protein [Nocardia sp. NBC_00416]|uniref:MmpS family transport accessory protein n=1 Tax=Nocardia sp. NBC_00416 TaxID=2975991 RepID=UPI002E245F83
MTDPSGDQREHPGQPQGHPLGQNPLAEPPPPGYRRSPRVRWPWLLGGLVSVVLCLVGGCLAVVAGVADEADEVSVPETTVTYQVEGTGSDVSITYLGRDLGMARETVATMPWRKEVTIGGFGTVVSLTANNDADGGVVTCRILIGDRVVAEQTSSGPYASAGCSGDAGGE